MDSYTADVCKSWTEAGGGRFNGYLNVTGTNYRYIGVQFSLDGAVDWLYWPEDPLPQTRYYYGVRGAYLRICLPQPTPPGPRCGAWW